MKLPRTLTICGHKIKVVVEKIDGATHGECDVDAKKISLDPTVLATPGLAVETLWHEVAHMATELSGIAFMFTDSQEEAYTRCVEYQLLPLIPTFAELIEAAKREEKKKRRKK